MSRRWMLAGLAIAAAVAAVIVVAVRSKRPPTATPVAPGADTTVIDGPLDASGLIDYETALNERLRGATTPDTNAVVLLVKAFGPRPEGGEMHADVYKWLGIDAPPGTGSYLLKSHEFFREELQVEDRQPFYDRESGLRNRPWTAAEEPRFAAWVKANEVPLAVVTEAARRPDYFFPLVARNTVGGRGTLLGALLPHAQRCREVAAILGLRVMLLCGEKKYDAAWRDVMTMHRLGRLMGKGATLIELLVGFALDAISGNSALRVLEAARPTAKQALAWRDELARLPPFPPLAAKIELSERFTFLDVCQFLRRDGVKVFGDSYGDTFRPFPDLSPEVVADALPRLDWNTVLRTGNGSFDRLAAALRKPARADRLASLAELQNDFQRFDPSRSDGADLGERVVGLFLPAVDKVSEANDRAEVTFRAELLAFALAAYHADTGKYPTRLSELLPKYAVSIPEDLYSGKELIYRQTATGYELYSVGPNGRDDGGQSISDDPRGDDYGVRMPNVKRMPPNDEGK